MVNAFAFQAAANLASVLLGLCLPYWLSDRTLGAYLMSNTVLQAGILVGMLGTKQTLERSFGLWGERERPVHFAALFAARAGFTALGALLAGGLALSFRESGLEGAVLWLLAAGVVVRSLAEVPFHLALSTGERTAGAWPPMVRGIVRLPLVLLGFHVGGLATVLALTLLVDLALGIAGTARAKDLFSWRWEGLRPPGMQTDWRFTREVAGYSVLVIALNALGPCVAAWLRPSPSELVDFTMGWQLALQFLQLHYVAQQATIPDLALRLRSADAEGIWDAVDAQARATWIVATSVTAAVALLSKPLILWGYGPDRVSMALPLSVSFAAASAWAMGSVFIHALFAAHKARAAVAVHGKMLAGAAVLFAVCAPFFGTACLPIVYAVVCVGGWIGAVQSYRSALRCPLALETLWRMAGSALTGGVALWIGRLLPAQAALALFLVVHGAGLWAFGLWKTSRGLALPAALSKA
jgi:hypothetical protein